MQKSIIPAELLEAMRVRQGISGQQLLNAFKALPKVSAIRLPPAFDDMDDIHPILLMLTDAERSKFQIPLSAMRSTLPAPPSPSPEPIYQVRVHGILCANDDGSGGAAAANAIDADYLVQGIEATNNIYRSAGIQFVYDPATDFERVNSSLLNLDFTVPEGLNYNLPESQPPLTQRQIDSLAKAHTDERQRIGRQHRHRMVLLFCDGNMLVYDDDRWQIISRTYAFSGSDAEYVALPTNRGGYQWFANLVAHETGHYFHQWHTHGRQPTTVADAAAIIKDEVEKGNFSVEEGAKVFDGDAAQVTDTPPDPGNSLFNTVYGQRGCSGDEIVKVPVTFSNGVQKEYSLTPERGNVMSYFKHCLSIPMHFSPMQVADMRGAMEEENRWHLIHPSMRLSILGAFVVNNQPSYYAVWHPSDEPEIQVYDWPYDKMRAKYDELWPQGLRLKLLSPYVLNGQVRYTAVWKPSTEGEIQVYDWPYERVRSKYDELWPQGWRLKLLSPYVVNGQVRYAAVWQPSTEGEIQVYDWPYERVRSKYDELWPQGWRLKLLSPYVLNGQVRYAAVWKPSTEGEIQVYDWPYERVRSKYDELWPQGWRLKLLSPYVLNGQVRYAAVWKPSTVGEIQVYGMPYEDVRALYDRMW